MINRIIFLFISISILSCSTKDKSELMIGTWSRCNSSGEYVEMKIMKDYTLIIGNPKDNIEKFKSKIINNSLIIYYKDIVPKIDTFELISYTDDKIHLKRKFILEQVYDFSRVKNKIDRIDSSNFDNWRAKTMLNFKKRGKLNDCSKFKNDENDENDENEYFDIKLELNKETEISIDSIL